MSGGLALLRAFSHRKIEHQVKKCCLKGMILKKNMAGAREMQAVCIKVITSSSVASPKCLGVANTLTLSEQQYFVRDTASQSTK